MTARNTLDFVSECSGDRLDTFLAAHSSLLTRSRVQRLIASGQVTVDGTRVKSSTKLRSGQHIHVTIPPREPTHLVPQDIPLDVVYENHDILVINKPAGLTVHPGPGHRDQTLANAILALVPNLENTQNSVRPGIVHRLDKDTSGLMVVAKNEVAHANLGSQFKERNVNKAYLTLAHGRISEPEFSIEAPIGRHPKDRKRMAIVSNGKEATTLCRVVKSYSHHTLIETKPITGRTHQIRVHMASIGHHIVGDATYGKTDQLLPRQFLHANFLGFYLPTSNVYVEYRAELPEDLREYLNSLK